ncbi:HTH-type transcriptional regulator BhcR [Pinisolibacter sp.]|uniref:HTH-type transcriptional regulator BhcR n=1 Tax=Pinisolibacter sp. TaxID=2172024 RepID=UPI002FDE0A44
MNATRTGRAMRGRPRGSGGKTPVASVQALDRALQLLELVAGTDGMTLTALAHASGLPASTVHRLLATLAAHGFVESDEPDQTWSIGVEAFRVGQAFHRRFKVATMGRPMMRELMEATGETANIGIFEGGDVVFISQVESSEPIRAFFRAGERRHAHASGIGKALLAEMPRERVARLVRDRGLPRFTDATITDPDRLYADLDEIRRRGWSLDDEERSRGMRCIAAPIFDENGEAIAGLSISGPSGRLESERIERLGPVVRRAADAVTRAIGGRPPGAQSAPVTDPR